MSIIKRHAKLFSVLGAVLVAGCTLVAVSQSADNKQYGVVFKKQWNNATVQVLAELEKELEIVCALFPHKCVNSIGMYIEDGRHVVIAIDHEEAATMLALLLQEGFEAEIVEVALQGESANVLTFQHMGEITQQLNDLLEDVLSNRVA